MVEGMRLDAWPLELVPTSRVDRRPDGRECIRGRWRYEDTHSTPQRPAHHAQDIFAPRGTRIRAPITGRVVAAGEGAISGRYAQLRNADGEVLLAHMDTLQVDRGELVRAGDLLGTVGTSGNAVNTCPHLHIMGWTPRPAHRPVNLYSELRRLDPTGPRARALGGEAA